MNFSHFFIRRPIFAGVLSAVIFLVGLISIGRLPISEYPEVVPPTVVVRATYPGANPKTIAETVASPLEQSVNGVEDSLYMFSQATPDGVMTLTVTFKLGTDVDKAQVQVQNRVSQVLSKLPDEVRSLGVTTTKQSPDLTMVVHLFSPSGRYDEVYLRNYATLQVKDVLARIPGAGDVQVFGSGDYAMRIWLNPDKVASRNLTASDVVRAVREQNVQVAAGAIGQQPASHVDFELQVNAKGRLVSPEEFGEIIVKTGPNGEKTLLKDIARIEMSADSYALRSLLNNKTAVALPIFQTPGANALQLSTDVRKTMDELKKNFPDGVDYSVVYDPTIFVRHSIEAVVHTLVEAILLVVLVVILFLQTWRASIIPLAAVPVSLVGTFAVMLALGFSINNLSLFGLVLAIGIVVDDAIVVVENVERNIELGYDPHEAARRAMNEVTSPIIATALVLCAVFVPTAFISGLTGQFYKQFAITIAISTVISAFNSLTLSPALCAVLLKGHNEPKDLFSRMMDKAMGWFFRPFNRAFAWAGNKYSSGVASVLRKSVAALIIYGALVFLTGWSFSKMPTGFVPTQDKQYLVCFAQLPDASSLDRTEAVIRRMSDIGLKQEGVESAVAFPGLSISGFSVSPNEGIVFFTLKPFDERNSKELSGPAIAQALNAKFSSIQDAFVLAVPPPPVNGLGTIGGFKMYVEDRGDLGYDALYQNMQGVIGKSYQPGMGLASVFSTFTVTVPQLDADINRIKAKQQGVPLENLFDTMQIYLGSLYINDFNRFGRTYEVIAQADAQFRDHPEDITRLKTRNDKGQMVPLGALMRVKETHGPNRALRYNGYPAAEINGGPAPGYSSGEAESMITKIAHETLPKGMSFEWTDLTYQRILAGNSAIYVYPLCLLLVFLVLAAQYESLRLPIAIILIVPMCLLFAITGVWLKGGDNNIFTQIGLIVLVGLACKNAILIVEFARHKQEEEGMPAFQAAVEASRLRLRPILMTSIAFIAGVFPLVVAHGAGAEMRQAMGVAVFSGMIGVTLFGLFLTPVFYLTLMRRVASKKSTASAPIEHKGPSLGAAGAVAAILLLLALPTQAGILTVGPDYKMPTNSIPTTYKAEELGLWKPGQPLDTVPKGLWWEVFTDATLNDLEAQAVQANQGLRAAVARVDQARATARVARADLLPTLTGFPSYNRQRYSPNQNPSFGAITTDTFSTPLDLSYEVDLWGRVRRGFESAREDAQASMAALGNVLLMLQSDVAQNYFRLRALDAEITTVVGTIGFRKEQVRLVQSRFNGGIGNELDIARAETELATTEAEAASLEQRRAELENALAILVGHNPTVFRLPAMTNGWNPGTPEIPAGLPSDLLERRPDVAQAERTLASSNAKIGVAKGAFFPVLTLTGSGGFLSADTDSLFNWSSRTWSFGPTLSIPIFTGGRNKANLLKAKATYDESLANYRQQVLVAFGDVENSLADIRHLRDQSAAQQRAVVHSRRAVDLATARYRSGIVSYIEVVDASRDALQSERANAELAGQRLIADVQLIKALGGSWQTVAIARADISAVKH